MENRHHATCLLIITMLHSKIDFLKLCCKLAIAHFLQIYDRILESTNPHRQFFDPPHPFPTMPAVMTLWHHLTSVWLSFSFRLYTMDLRSYNKCLRQCIIQASNCYKMISSVCLIRFYLKLTWSCFISFWLLEKMTFFVGIKKNDNID